MGIVDIVMGWLGFNSKPVHQDEWLTFKKSGISHKFYVTDKLNNAWRYSACGFSTKAENLKPYDGMKHCPKCQKSKGWG